MAFRRSPSPPRAIGTLGRLRAEPFTARIPGSKSYTHRALLLAAMRPGTTEVVGGLHSDDTDRLAKALAAFGGLSVEPTAEGFRVERAQGRLRAPPEDLDMGAAGTPARFLLSFAAAAEGSTVLTGAPRLRERPMADLLDALRSIGIRCECLAKEGFLPVRVQGGPVTSRDWRVRGGVSSQFTSSLLLFATGQPEGPIRIEIEGNQVSRPYVEMTRALMEACGIAARRAGEGTIVVTPAAPLLPRIPVEIDASALSYFLAAAALTGSTVIAPGIGGGSLQGDLGLARALERMGCGLELGEDSVRITGGRLRGIEIDMESMPDSVLTLAAVAARAEGPTRITNIGTLRLKECDRLAAAARELERVGARVEAGPDFLGIHPAGHLRPARIRTDRDHRVAMSFALLGLVADGISIEDPDCVGKSFPGFWEEFERLRRHHAGP